MNLLFQRLRQLGIDNNVSFSGQELLKDCIIGFAGVHRKVFVLKQLDDTAFQSFVIDLNEVKMNGAAIVNIKINDLCKR